MLLPRLDEGEKCFLRVAGAVAPGGGTWDAEPTAAVAPRLTGNSGRFMRRVAVWPAAQRCYFALFAPEDRRP